MLRRKEGYRSPDSTGQEWSLIAYKHVPLDYADRFASGDSVRIGTLADFREAEGDRADPLEGVTEYTIGNPTHYDVTDPTKAAVREKIEAFLPFKLERMYEDNIVFRDNIFQFVQPTTYVFCCSAEPDFERVARGEAIFRLTDLRRFARRIARRSNGVLGTAQYGPVIYEQRSVDPFAHGLLAEGPFQKSRDLEWEREIRIVWPARIDGLGTIFVRAPWISYLVERIG